MLLRCQLVNNLLFSIKPRLISSLICSLHAHTLKVSSERKRIPLSEVKSYVRAMERILTSDINTIHNSVLWSCIDDDMNDAILLESLGKSLDGEEDSEQSPAPAAASSRVSRIIRQRTHILTYLQQNIIQLLNNNNNVRLQMPYVEEECQAYLDVLSLKGIARVFRMTVSISTHLNGSSSTYKVRTTDETCLLHLEL